MFINATSNMSCFGVSNLCCMLVKSLGLQRRFFAIYERNAAAEKLGSRGSLAMYIHRPPITSLTENPLCMRPYLVRKTQLRYTPGRLQSTEWRSEACWPRGQGWRHRTLGLRCSAEMASTFLESATDLEATLQTMTQMCSTRRSTETWQVRGSRVVMVQKV